MSEESATKELKLLEKQIRQVRGMVKLVMYAILLLLFVVNAKALYMLPYYETMLENIVGSQDKLPDLTRFIFQYQHLPNHAGLWGTAGVTLLAMLMLLAWRRSLFPVLFAVIVAVLLGVQWAAIETGVNMGLATHFHSMSTAK